MGERAKLSPRPSHRACLSLLVVALSGGCTLRRDAPQPCYEVSSGRLVRLDADTRHDGFIDQRTYLEGNVPFRTESDTDRDGRIDRWEYVDQRAQVVKLGTSSRNDGIEDQWVYPGDAGGEQRVERSSDRSPRVDRREFYRNERLVRAEEDTNEDGRFDKWEVLEGGVVREMAFDSTRATGRPDRKLIYDGLGRYLRMEVDTDGDGRFEVMAPTTP